MWPNTISSILTMRIFTQVSPFKFLYNFVSFNVFTCLNMDFEWFKCNLNVLILCSILVIFCVISFTVRLFYCFYFSIYVIWILLFSYIFVILFIISVDVIFYICYLFHIYLYIFWILVFFQVYYIFIFVWFFSIFLLS